ncbi:MAG: tetratricopeptide repeat protein [Alphaproteobacteria bacterium]|nr:tetratricopeptide repeat protein [Alphaproteobacteria bacterium]
MTAILAQIDKGTENLAKLQDDIDKGQLFANAESLKRELDAASEGIEARVKESQNEVQFALKRLTDGMAALHTTASELKENMKREIRDDIENDPALLREVVASAAEEFSKEGALDRILVSQLERKVFNVDGKYQPGQRAQALQLMAVFASEPLLRTHVSFVLKSEPAQNKELIAIALRSYPPGAEFQENHAAVEAVLKLLKDEAPRSDEMRDSYTQFLTRLPSKQVPQIAEWLQGKIARPSREIALNSLVKIGGDETLRALVEFARHDDKAISGLSLRGLSVIDSNTVSPEVRGEALKEIWDIFVRSIRAEEELPDFSSELRRYLDDMAAALRRNNPRALRRLASVSVKSKSLVRYKERALRAVETNDSKMMKRLANTYGSNRFYKIVSAQGGLVGGVSGKNAFVNLLRSTDWKNLVKAPFWPADAETTPKGKLIVDTLLTSWVRHLENGKLDSAELSERSDQLLKKTLAIGGSLYREKLAKVLEFAVERASEDGHSGFLKRFIEWYRDVPEQGDEVHFRADGALASAVDRDSKSESSPYALTRELIRKVGTGGGNNWKLLETLLPALDNHLQDAKVSEFVLDVAQSLKLKSENLGAILAAVQVLGNLDDQDVLPRATEALLERLQSFAGAAEERASLDQEEREERRELANAVMRSLSRYARVPNDADMIMAAIMRQRPAEETIGFKFTELKASKSLGRRFSRHGRNAANTKEWQRAVEYYSAAIALDKDYAFAYKVRAISYIMLGDEPSATKDIRDAMALYDTPSDKAGAFENLGLLYIGNGEWQRALKHTKEVNDLYDQMSWNWLIRAIAAHNLGQKDLEQEAHAKWTDLNGDADVPEVQTYIGQQLDAYLSDRSKISDMIAISSLGAGLEL